MEEEESRCFLSRFRGEFPAALEKHTPLPMKPASPKICPEHLHGTSLDLGLRLLQDRGAPSVLGSLLCHAAVSELLESDLTMFHCQREEEEPLLLDSEAVLRVFVDALINAALRWQLSAPALPVQPQRLVSSHAIRNTRRKMEDKHVIVPHFSLLFGLHDGVQRSYLAVFDGHGGADAASFASLQLHVSLSRQKDLTSDPERAFKRAFKETDQMFHQKARRERLRSGSTAVAALIQGQRLLVAWLGDSQALLVRNGKEEEIMDPHKPDREDERQRVEALGGCVTFMGCWRVNGTYAVSRAFGDFDQKPFVSSEADVSSVELQGDEDFLLLACDGFFDSIKPCAVPGLVLEALRGGAQGSGQGQGSQEAALRVAQVLVSQAKDAGSSDNITVVLMFLRPPLEILQDSAPSV
ncbi:protein phosphatase 1F [Eucyclogobius newberryi]|uniref:protein phosphatase 1F n=1 Tax=Eucyclogobius newberryi TaxID=166745 RepID=UPI003B59AC77